MLCVIHTHGVIYSLWLASELGVGGWGVGGMGEISPKIVRMYTDV